MRRKRAEERAFGLLQTERDGTALEALPQGLGPGVDGFGSLGQSRSLGQSGAFTLATGAVVETEGMGSGRPNPGRSAPRTHALGSGDEQIGDVVVGPFFLILWLWGTTGLYPAKALLFEAWNGSLGI